MADKNNKRLGKGLGAIFGEDLSEIIEEIQNKPDESYGKRMDIDIEKISPNPYQPRRVFDEAKIDELSQSILQHGVFTPILVRETLNGYQLIAGERRMRASQKVGLMTIPAIIMDFSDEEMMEIGLLENIQREDLSVIEEANAYSQMIQKLGYTQDRVAARIGKSREHVANLLRLLRLPEKVQEMVTEGTLTMGHVRPLITIEDQSKVVKLAEKIAKDKLSVREVEKMVREPNPIGAKPKVVVQPDKFVEALQQQLQSKLQTTVKIKEKELVIRYQDSSDLNRILTILDLIDQEDV